ncbi:MAG TPA: DUF4404 family protein [Steroidobacteraceae bacterium]|nr:DUF4404 family protein [Steroidobacteraceae bacterium]
MDQASLRDLLAQLHERLRSSASVDAEGRDMLRTVLSDIEHTLSTGSPGESPAVPADDEGAGHASRLEALAVRFEAQHPAIAGLLRQTVDLLEKAGI